MQYFDRTRKCANILLTGGIVFFVISIAVFLNGSVIDQIFEFSNGNSVREGIIFAIFFILGVLLLVVSIALRCIVKDAKEELDSISRRQEKTRK